MEMNTIAFTEVLTLGRDNVEQGNNLEILSGVEIPCFGGGSGRGLERANVLGYFSTKIVNKVILLICRFT